MHDMRIPPVPFPFRLHQLSSSRIQRIRIIDSSPRGTQELLPVGPVGYGHWEHQGAVWGQPTRNA